MPNGFVTTVNRPIQFVEAFLNEFSQGSHICFSGDLSLMKIEGIPIVPIETAKVFHEGLSNNLENALVVPVAIEIVPRIVRQLLIPGGIRNRITHILFNQDGRKIFNSHDNFCKDCTFIFDTVKQEFVESLLIKRILQYYIVYNETGADCERVAMKSYGLRKWRGTFNHLIYEVK